MRTTHTFVTLEVSYETYMEIWEKLAHNDYHQAFIDGAIDMRGIVLITKERTEKEKELAEFAKDFAKQAVRQIFQQANK